MSYAYAIVDDELYDPTPAPHRPTSNATTQAEPRKWPVVRVGPHRSWHMNAVVRAIGFVDLRPGWNGHHAPTPSFDAVMAILGALSNLPADVIPPLVMPTAEGGAQLEWHQDGWNVEVVADPAGSLWAWLYHPTDGVEYDFDEDEYLPHVLDVVKKFHQR